MVENPSLQTTQLEKTISEPNSKPIDVDKFVPSGPYAGSTDQTPQTQAQTITSPVEGGKCTGFISSPSYCANILMPDGTIVENPSCTNVSEIPGTYKMECPYLPQSQTQTQTVEREEEDDDDNEKSSREKCEEVQDSGCDEAVEKEKEIAKEGREWIDGEFFEYDEDNYWLPEEE
jgi:hypothetical protein